MKKLLFIIFSICCIFSCSGKKNIKYETQFSTIKQFVQEKNTEELKKIFSIKINLTNAQQDELVRYSINSKYENAILLLIKNGMSADYKIDGKTILYYSVKNSQYYFATQLIDNGANPFEKSEYGSEIIVLSMNSNYKLLQKKIIDKMNTNLADVSTIDFSQSVYNLSPELFKYLVNTVTNDFKNSDIFTLTIRELLRREEIETVLQILNNEKAFECLLNSKFTPYIVSENFIFQTEIKKIINRLIENKLNFSSSEPYIQSAIDNEHYDSIKWLVENGANWKDELIYFASNDNVLNYLYYKQKFAKDEKKRNILAEYVKYFESK
ncbi:hypothetical protein [Treponema sp.]|uniref:hypothetical protein n=1 Tax=Treponema sp. TaxID=166 RepID=UPI00298DD440|nr:hypothetical protein [Treponema sp.]MCR5613913.1 hypothetical protein [Treponema sp.]